MDLIIGRRGDARDDGVGILEPRLHALEVQDGEPAEPRQLAGEAGVDDGVHRGREDGDLERQATERLIEANVGGFDGLRPGGERDVLEAVRRADAVDLRTEAPPTRRGSLSLGHPGAGLRRHIHRCPTSLRPALTPSLPAADLGPRAAVPPPAVELELEPARPLRIREVIADPLEGRAIPRPDDRPMRLVERQPARAVVLV